MVLRLITRASDSKDKAELEDAIRQGEAIAISNLVLEKPRAILLKQKFKYIDRATLFEACEDGATKLVKGTYLRACKRILRRQDLPEATALWYANILKSVYKHLEMVAISYCWMEPGNPDPYQEQLKIFQKVIDSRLKCMGQAKIQDLAIFLDYMSLYQQPRTPEQQAAFDRGLANVNLWYTHQDTVVWLQTWLPARVQNKYDARGWPTFERAVSWMITDTNSVLDLGPGGKSITEDERSQDWTWLFEACKAGRKPPRVPEEFRNVLMTKHFTAGADMEKVANKYEKTFTEVLNHAEQLWFADLGWDDTDAKELAAVLPYCKSLLQLILSGNAIQYTGAQMLVAAASQCLKLRTLDLSGNKLETTAEFDNHAGNATTGTTASLLDMWTENGKDSAELRLDDEVIKRSTIESASEENDNISV
jgi:hypothetical protein